MKRVFPNAISYNRFVELEQRVFFKLIFLLKLFTFGRCTGVSFVDREYIFPKLFDSLFDDRIQLVHSRHRSITNFPVNLVAVLGAYCFFENKPDALQGYYIEDSKQLVLF